MKLSADILEEVRLFANSVVLGAVLTFIYDGWLILRKVFKHSTFWISIEDLLFWFGTALVVFMCLHEQSQGVLRWFIVAGAGVGMLLYKNSLSRFYVKYIGDAVLHLVVYIKRLAYFVLKPVKWVKKCVKSGFSKVNLAIKKVTIILKNQLTAYIKWFTIALCKHNGEDGDLHNDK